MIHTAQKIWQLPLLLLALWLGGCAMQYDPDEFLRPQYPEGDLNLVLNIHTGDRTLKSTRADYNNNDGVIFEPTTIDRELLNTLRVIIVNSYTKKIIYNDYLNFLEINDQTAVSEYSGLKYKVDYSTEYRIYLIGNEDGLKLNTTQTATLAALKAGEDYEENTLENMTIGATAPGLPIITDSEVDKLLPVPMSEIFDITTVSKEEANPDADDVIQNETFFLTRAASKFSFYFFRAQDFTETTLENRKIKEISISGLGKDEYLFPNETEYYPAKDTDRETTNRRDIKEFKLPSGKYPTNEYKFALTSPIEVKDLPVKSADFNCNYPTAGLTAEQIAACQYIPELYFPESKGKGYDGTDTRGREYTFECSIAYEDGVFVSPVKLNNLPHALPRNTHVVVIATIHDRYMTVDVIPFTAVELKPDFGLEREKFTGYVVSRDANGNITHWYDGNYYESAGSTGAPTDPTPLYLGPAGHPGELVTINSKRYMLVYSKPERSAADLDHFFEVFTETNADGEEVPTVSPVKHWLSYAAITGYEALTPDIYINDKGERVYIENWGYYAFPGTYNEWGIADFFPDQWGGEDVRGNSGYYPSFWFDILGNKYDVPKPPTYPTKPTEPLSPNATDFGINVESNPWQGTDEQWAAYNRAIANYNLEHSIWEADMQKWNADVEIWRPLNEKWKTDFTTIRENKLGGWLDYLQ